MASTDTSPDQLHALALQLSQDFLPQGWERAASATYSRVAYNPQLGLYYKEFLPRSPAQRLAARVRGSRATRIQRNTRALHHYGFNAPLPVHHGSLGRGHEYLFMPAVPGKSVQQWLFELRGASARRERKALLRALGNYIGRLHATGFIHGALRRDNIFADKHPGGFHFALLDNEHTTRHAPPAGRSMLRNLASLNTLPLQDLGVFDRMCFFRAWRSQMRHLSNVEARVVAREAQRAAQRQLAHEAR